MQGQNRRNWRGEGGKRSKEGVRKGEIDRRERESEEYRQLSMQAS